VEEKAAVALAATLHDPTGALGAEIRRRLPALRRLYGGIAVATSPPTAASVVALLAASGVHAGTPATNTRGPLYRLALRRALASGAARIHYLDFDRALHWVARAPRELAALSRLARRYRALLVGRTLAAHRTHHRPLWVTETEVNARFAARLGLRGRVDFLVPSVVLTREVAARLLARSRARDAAIYGEWVALLAGIAGELAYVECRGLDWETPDRHRRVVRRVGLTAWRRRMETPSEWRRREAMAGEFARGFERALARWPVQRLVVRRRSRSMTSIGVVHAHKDHVPVAST
jgi:hypothetical protein